MRGKVVEHDSNGLYIDIGGKAPGFLPNFEVVVRPSETIEELLPVGWEGELLIVKGQDADGAVTLSLKRLQAKQAWNQLKDYQAQGKTFTCRAIEGNRGGLVVNAEGLRGFIPQSHLADKQLLAAPNKQSLDVVVLELDEARHRIVLSNRLAVRAAALGQLGKGQLVEGTVSGLRPFGAFVDLGGISGLLHVREISQKRVGDPANVFEVGDPVKAVVLDIDESRQRVSLSTKILELHPGEMLESRESVFANAQERLETNISKLWDA